jgi:hypothetical protein
MTFRASAALRSGVAARARADGCTPSAVIVSAVSAWLDPARPASQPAPGDSAPVPSASPEQEDTYTAWVRAHDPAEVAAKLVQQRDRVETLEAELAQTLAGRPGDGHAEIDRMTAERDSLRAELARRTFGSENAKTAPHRGGYPEPGTALAPGA